MPAPIAIELLKYTLDSLLGIFFLIGDLKKEFLNNAIQEILLSPQKSKAILLPQKLLFDTFLILVSH